MTWTIPAPPPGSEVDLLSELPASWAGVPGTVEWGAFSGDAPQAVVEEAMRNVEYLPEDSLRGLLSTTHPAVVAHCFARSVNTAVWVVRSPVRTAGALQPVTYFSQFPAFTTISVRTILHRLASEALPEHDRWEGITEGHEWRFSGEIPLRSGSLLIHDARFIPDLEGGVLVNLAIGIYAVSYQSNDYRGDLRVARVRLLLAGAEGVRGRQIGETWTDTAQTGFCDYEVYRQSWAGDASYDIIERQIDEGVGVLAGIAVLDETVGAVMPFVASGFGDGSYPVFELLDREVPVGVEVEYILPGTLPTWL